MADKLKLKCGDRVFAYFINNEGVRTRRFTIEGIYQTNLQQYDESVCLTDIYTVNKLNGWEPDQYSGAELTVNNFNNLDETAQHIINKVNRTEDRYGGTYSGLNGDRNESTDILLARLDGPERVDDSRADGSRCGCDHDLRTTYHYP